MPLEPTDIGVASSGSRQYDPNVAFSFDQNSTYGAGDQFSAAFASADMLNPSKALFDITDAKTDLSPVIGADEFNLRYGVEGPTPETSLQLKPGQSIGTNTAFGLKQLFTERQRLAWIESHGPSTLPSELAGLSGGLIGNAIDPLNVAAAFVPGAGEARLLKTGFEAVGMTRAAALAQDVAHAAESSMAARTAVASINNASAIALVQPIVYAGAQQDHIDYSFQDAAENVLFGGLLGGGLHLGGEAIGGLFRGFKGDPDVARNVMTALASRDDAQPIPPEMVDAMHSLDPQNIASDLEGQTGEPATQDQVAAELQARAQQFHDEAIAGNFEPKQPDAATPSQPLLTESQALAKNDYSQAAQVVEQQVQKMESDPYFKPADEAVPELNEPIDRLKTIKSAFEEFTNCVLGQA